MTYRELVEAAVVMGAKRPIWNGDEEVAQCWADRAEWLLSRQLVYHVTFGKMRELIAECDRYSGAA